MLMQPSLVCAWRHRATEHSSAVTQCRGQVLIRRPTSAEACHRCVGDAAARPETALYNTQDGQIIMISSMSTTDMDIYAYWCQPTDCSALTPLGDSRGGDEGEFILKLL